MNTKQRLMTELSTPLLKIMNDDAKALDILEPLLMSGEAPNVRALELAASVAGLCATKSMQIDAMHDKIMAASTVTEACVQKLINAHSEVDEKIDPYWNMLQHYMGALSILIAIKECNVYRSQVMQRQAAQRHHDLNCKECSPKVATTTMQ